VVLPAWCCIYKWDIREKRQPLPEKESNTNQGKSLSAVPRGIGVEIELFVNQIDALAETLPLATLAIREVHSASRQKLSDFLKAECEPLVADGKTTSYRIDVGQHTRYLRLMRRVHKAVLAQLLVPRGLLVALVSQFDAYVGALIRQLFKLKPEIVDSSGRTLTFSQLTEFGSIEAAREYIVDKEIEAVLRNSHSDQFEWLENKFNLPLRKDLPSWPIFIEVTERRNLFVHTNGIISSQYLEVCRKHKCSLPDGVCFGQLLPLTPDYFATACDCLLEIGVKLGQVLWRKIEPNELQNADGNLIRITYDLITEGRYKLARVLLDFATETLRVHSTESHRLTMVVNRAQTYKWSGDEEGCKRILDAEDWSATSSRFKLAHAVLRDDFDGANAIAKQIGKDDNELNKHSYRDWPLFKKLRKSNDFALLFEKIFGEPLNKVVWPEDEPNGPQPTHIN
jgi:hypothetical protein